MESIFLAFLTTFTVSVGAVGYVVLLHSYGFISPLFGRKLMHIGAGPALVLCWPLFPEATLSRFAASLVSLVDTLYFALVGSGVLNSQHLVAVVSRNGARSELLVGPVLYGAVITLSTIVFWRNSPTGIIAILVLCVGDGVSDIFGRKYGKSNPLPWNKTKSWAGCTAFWIGGYSACVTIGWAMASLGYMGVSFGWNYLLGCLVAVTVAMFVESLPIKEIDNLTIFLACALTGKLIWP